jgi:hypothetical protein
VIKPPWVFLGCSGCHTTSDATGMVYWPVSLLCSESRLLLNSSDMGATQTLLTGSEQGCLHAITIWLTALGPVFWNFRPILMSLFRHRYHTEPFAKLRVL